MQEPKRHKLITDKEIAKLNAYLEKDRKYVGLVFYAQSVPARSKTSTLTAPYLLELKVFQGEMERVKLPRHNGNILSEYVVLESEPFPSDMQDPDDYMEIDPSDVETVIGYRFKGIS